MDRVTAVTMTGRLLVLTEFLSVMAEKKTVSEREFIHSEQADRRSAASNVQQMSTARVASAWADYRMYGQNAREQLCFKCLCGKPPLQPLPSLVPGAYRWCGICATSVGASLQPAPSRMDRVQR